MSENLSIYLAGKIAKNDWRHEVTGLRGEWGSDGEPSAVWMSWPTMPGVVHGLDYVGPYFMSDDHGCGHGENSHGCGVEEAICGGAYPAPDRARTQRLCFDAIRRADVFFAWLESDAADPADLYDWGHCTGYGTLVELGYAKALGKTIIVATPLVHDDGWHSCSGGHGCICGRDDLWFALECADAIVTAQTPIEALNRCQDTFERQIANDQAKLLESPIERDFWSAYCGTMPAELTGMVPQHKVSAGGKNYRLDFAIPLKKLAFEMDGKTYHDTNKGWVNDRRRDLHLELDGWRVHRFDGDLIRKDPAAVVAMCVQFAT